MKNCEKQVRKFYSELWAAPKTDEGTNERMDEMSKVLHKNVTFRGSLGDTKTGHAGFAEYVDMVHAALSDYRCIVEELVIEEPKVFAKMTFTGVHTGEFMGFAPSGKQVRWAGAALFSFDGGKIDDVWVLGDLKSLESQLNENLSSGNQK